MRLATLFLIFIIYPYAPAIAAPPPPPPEKAAAFKSFVEGLDALDSGKLSQALEAFSQALQRNSSDPDFILARGVTAALMGQFKPALADFQRVERLNPKRREAKLWTYVTEAMSGILTTPNSAPRPPRSLQNSPDAPPPIVSVPGHIIQGSSEYSTNYASFLVYELAMPYQETRVPPQFGGEKGSRSPRDPVIQKAIVEAGQWFANRNKTRPELAHFLFERAKQLHIKQKFKEALDHLTPVRASYPGDADVRFYSGAIWLGLGRLASAREELTIALTLRTQFAEAYLLRSAASAQLGDANRARQDFQLAKNLKPDLAKQYEKQIQTDIAENQMKEPAEKLLAQLEKEARSKTKMETLIDQAVKVHKAAAATRLKYDEIYQDQIRVLEDALRADPKNPDRCVDLAIYITEESYLRGDTVEPRNEKTGYRWQESESKELRRAESLLDQAIGLNPRHVRAIMQKAMVRARFRDTRNADSLAQKALSLAPNDPEALQMYAMYKGQQADNLNAAASGLRQDSCSSSTRTENRHDGVWEVKTTTCYKPTQSDLARAAQLDAQAQMLRRESILAMQKALRASKGTLKGYLLEATYDMWSGNSSQALPVLNEAVKRWPKSLEVHDALVKYHQFTGHFKNTEEQKVIRNQLIHTTADPMLRLSWGLIPKTNWLEARKVLAKARVLDPVDARVPAYLGVVFQNEGDQDSTQAAFRTAIALEEARLRLDGLTDPKGSKLHRDPMDFGTAMESRLKLAAAKELAAIPKDALNLYQDNINYESHILPFEYSRLMFTGFFPDPNAPLTPIPFPQNVSTLMADSRLGAGKILKSMGKKKEALDMFAKAASFGRQPGSMTPNIGNAKGDSNFGGQAKGSSAEAMLELAKQHMELGDYETAFQYAQAATQNSPPEHLRKELNQVNDAIVQKLNSRQNRFPQKDQNSSGFGSVFKGIFGN